MNMMSMIVQLKPNQVYHSLRIDRFDEVQWLRFRLLLASRESRVRCCAYCARRASWSSAISGFSEAMVGKVGAVETK